MKVRLAAIGLALATAFAAVPQAAPLASSQPLDCGDTTLEGTAVDLNADGILECGPGQALVVREELAAAQAGRDRTRFELGTFFSLADFQYADEESPLRGEWADKCESHPATSAFRPHETMVGHLMETHVRAANRLAAQGGPILGEGFDLSLALGDLADNQQFNETRFFIDVLDGQRLVNPDSGDPADAVPGGDGYDGVQTSDPEGAPASSPIKDLGNEDIHILETANEPFWAEGLRNADGSPIPWYSVLGNHDVKVQGTIPDDDPAWRAFVRQWVLGRIKVMDLDPDAQQEACDQQGFSDPDFWTSLFTGCAAVPPDCEGTTQLVPADPDRRLLDREQWIEQHFETDGLPEGHGFAEESRRCPSDSPDPHQRGCYTFDHGLFRFIVLDTAAAEGLEGGNLDHAQFIWLEEQLQAASRKYFAPDGSEKENTNGTNRLIVVASHHTIDSTNNTGPSTGQESGTRGEIHDGTELRDLLLRFPNVIMQLSGHTHQNKIWAHRNEDLGTGYWEVNTAAVADHPSQSRTIEIADNRDGTLSIFAVNFDAAVAPDPRTIDWQDHDHTHETEIDPEVADQNVNEEWLASAGREVQFHDPQVDKAAKMGQPEDRNVELLIGRPFQLPSAAAIRRCERRGPEGATPVIGTNGADRLIGTSGPDLFCGLGGRDQFRGLGSDDALFGDAKSDRLRGGRGRDLLVGGPAPDVLRGHRGRDLLRGGGGRDRCRGGKGRDRVRGCRT